MFIRARSVMTSIGTMRSAAAARRAATLSRLNATRLPSPTALTTISGWPDPSCTMSPAAKKFVSPSRPNRSILIVPRSFLNSSGSQSSDACCPTAMITLSTAKRSAGASRSMAIGDALIAPREARRMQLQRFDLAVAEHGGHRPAVHQLDALLEHVVQIFGHARHLARCCLRR